MVNACKIYVDEFGMNIHTKRNQARSVSGTRAYHTVSGQRGQNVTVCLGLTAEHGIVYYEIFQSPDLHQDILHDASLNINLILNSNERKKNKGILTSHATL